MHTWEKKKALKLIISASTYENWRKKNNLSLKQAEEIIKVKTEKQGKNKINREESMKPNVVLWKKNW